jgi:hypothetical protein
MTLTGPESADKGTAARVASLPRVEAQRARELAQATVDVGHWSKNVTDRSAFTTPLASHLESIPDPDDLLASGRGAGAALITVTGAFVFDTELREHDRGQVRTIAYRLDDTSLSMAYDSVTDDAAGSRRTVWHFRFGGGQVEIAGIVNGPESDEAEAFARRLAAKVARG